MSKIDGKQIKAGSIPSSALVTPVGVSTPSKNDKGRNPNVTAGNNVDSGLSITGLPVGMVLVMINGVEQVLGDGVKTKDCYFSADAGVTAKAIGAIAVNDKLFWNGTIAGFDLAVSDIVDLVYNT